MMEKKKPKFHKVYINPALGYLEDKKQLNFNNLDFNTLDLKNIPCGIIDYTGYLNESTYLEQHQLCLN